MEDNPKDWCKECGEPVALYDCFDDPVCDCDDTGPAPKEERMAYDKRCEQYQMRYDDGETCPSCTARLRAVYERAFDAALAGVASDIDLTATEHVRFADTDALEAVRTHAARMAALDAVIAELEGETE